MAEIHRIVRITSDSSSIDPVRRYTDSERKAKMEKMEDEIKEHAEMIAIHREIKVPESGKPFFYRITGAGEKSSGGKQSRHKR